MQLEMFQQSVPVNIAKLVTKSSISRHCIQIIHLIRRKVTKKNTLKRLIFPVAYPEGEAEASGLRRQTYLKDRTII